MSRLSQFSTSVIKAKATRKYSRVARINTPPKTTAPNNETTAIPTSPSIVQPPALGEIVAGGVH